MEVNSVFQCCSRSSHNPCNRFSINFHIWKLIQCECNLSQIWKLTWSFSVAIKDDYTTPKERFTLGKRIIILGQYSLLFGAEALAMRQGSHQFDC